MTHTTQDLRALIARLQARLGEGTQGFPLAWYAGHGIDWLGHSDDPQDAILVVDSDTHQFRLASTAPLIAAALNELPAQIARWLARLDEADALELTAGDLPQAPENKCDYFALIARADGAREAVTEDVQAWAVRLGVGE